MRAILGQHAVRAGRIVGVDLVVFAAERSAVATEGVGREVLQALPRLPAQRQLHRIVGRRADVVVEIERVQFVEWAERGEIIADARDRDAVDRHRQIHTVERAGAQHPERHDIAIDAADQIAPARADVTHLHHLVEWKPAGVRQAEAVRLRPLERARRQRIDADAADPVGQRRFVRRVVGQADAVAIVRSGPEVGLH